MLTEVDIIRIMAAQRQLTESVADNFIERDALEFIDDDELFEMLDYDMSVSETNGLM